MTEAEIRAALRRAGEHIDAVTRAAAPELAASRAAKVGLVVWPLVLGAGLGLAACTDEPREAYGMPTGGHGTTTTSTQAGGAGGSGGVAGIGGGGETGGLGGQGGEGATGLPGGAMPGYGVFGGYGGAGGAGGQ